MIVVVVITAITTAIFCALHDRLLCPIRIL